jgi:hypothetical protein
MRIGKREHFSEDSDFKEMPRDFWNYPYNPITGFSYTIRTTEARRSKRKYFKTYDKLQQ